MPTPNLRLISEFERHLDAALAALPSVSGGGEAWLSLAAGIIEEAYALKNYGAARQLRRGLQVLAPFFLQNYGAEEPAVEQLVRDLDFAGHYFALWENLYYTYNAPGSFDWEFNGSDVRIRFQDRSIPRQYYLQSNNWFVISMERFADNSVGNEILSHLRDKEQVRGQPIDEGILSHLEREAKSKVESYFNFLSGEPLSLGRYSFAEFERVFKVLLILALYHRYHGKALNLHGPVHFERAELLDNLALSTELPRQTCECILSDITYSRRVAKAGVQPMYYSLYELERSDRVLMMPNDFAMWEGYIDILRITALRSPRLYTENISSILSAKFTQAVAAMFSAQGFKCSTDVKLSNFDSRLPDIDLLAISEEPTLGYVVLACELKAPIPPQWAKDHLRVLNKDSVSKAFEQLGKVERFFSTADGHQFLRSRLPVAGLPHFRGSFVAACWFLIATSWNAGMFFGDRKHTIIDYQTLQRALAKCDGDSAYLLHVLKNLPSWLDEGFAVEKYELTVRGRKVAYDVFKINRLLDFPANVYKSAGLDKQMLEEFLKDGGHPFDVFTASESVADDNTDGEETTPN